MASGRFQMRSDVGFGRGWTTLGNKPNQRWAARIFGVVCRKPLLSLFRPCPCAASKLRRLTGIYINSIILFKFKNPLINCLLIPAPKSIAQYRSQGGVPSASQRAQGSSGCYVPVFINEWRDQINKNRSGLVVFLPGASRGMTSSVDPQSEVLMLGRSVIKIRECFSR